jgi:hypothetical protein
VRLRSESMGEVGTVMVDVPAQKQKMQGVAF